ncbi:MAG: ATP--guanido phosphotransferase, partial [Clostridia bacterium]|nr:ATP--guanido phosphotransferase [Clostridia bacterium]
MITIQSDHIVLSCRVRLARNLKERSFVNTQSAEDAEVVLADVSAVFPPENGYRILRMDALPPLERASLVENHLCSTELIAADHSGVILNKDRTLSIMVNEEDHLRIQGILPGLNLSGAYALCRQAEETIAVALPYAFDSQLGYLTACPTNLGTGMRASAMLHLAGLAITGQAEPLLSRIAKLGVAVRGFYGEGSGAPGHIYQISNQYTLGVQERELMDALSSIIGQLAAQEARARGLLLSKRPLELADMIGRALGVCRYARKMTLTECMQELSAIKLGVSLGLLPCPMEQIDGLE